MENGKKTKNLTSEAEILLDPEGQVVECVTCHKTILKGQDAVENEDGEVDHLDHYTHFYYCSSRDCYHFDVELESGTGQHDLHKVSRREVLTKCSLDEEFSYKKISIEKGKEVKNGK